MSKITKKEIEKIIGPTKFYCKHHKKWFSLNFNCNNCPLLEETLLNVNGNGPCYQIDEAENAMIAMKMHKYCKKAGKDINKFLKTLIDKDINENDKNLCYF